jgi:hypothetical protein
MVLLSMVTFDNVTFEIENILECYVILENANSGQVKSIKVLLRMATFGDIGQAPYNVEVILRMEIVDNCDS